MATKNKSYITTFFYECELSFISEDDQEYQITKECVNYILIEHDYKNRVMPIIYLRVKLLPSIYNKMVPQQHKAKVYFQLKRKRNKGSTSSTYKTVIRDAFEYYMTDDPNNFKELETTGEESGSAYKTCYLGLLKIELQTKNLKQFGGVYKNTNTMSLVQDATKGMQMIIQPFANNTNIKEFTCPTVSTIGQFLQYLNSQYSFYAGSYIYYLDFDKTYLRSNDGSYIDTKDGDFKYMAFDIRDLTKYTAFSTGMIEDSGQDAYIVYVSGTDASLNVDRSSSELAGSVTNVNNTANTDSNNTSASAGSTQTTNTTITQSVAIDTSAITSISSNMGSNILLNSSDPNAAKNLSTIIAENANTLTISKADMDSRVFTPNKQYVLCNYEDNAAYCGIYYLVSKREIYVRNGAQLKCTMIITMRKSADFVNQTTDANGNATSKDAKLI